MLRPWMRFAGIAALVTTSLATMPRLLASDLLQGTIHPATATIDANETSPVLTNDGISNVLVYTRRNVEGPRDGVIYSQRVSADGVPMGAPEPITFSHDEFTNNGFADASGSYIVYVSREPSNPARGLVRLYDIRTGGTIKLTTVADNVRGPRIHGNIVAWVQGDGAASRVQFVDLGWPVLTPTMLSGTARAQSVDVGSRYIVWEEFDGTSVNVEAYDMWAGLVLPVASDPATHERAPATSGDHVAWQEESVTPTGSRTIHARNLTAGAASFPVSTHGGRAQNASIDGELIAYDSDRTGNPDVYVYRLSDGTSHQVTSGAAPQTNSNVIGDLVAFVHVAAGVGNDLQTDISVAHLDSVADVVAPTITCPANITVSAGSSGTSAVVSYPAPSAADNSLSLSAVSAPASGSTFPLGETAVTGTATDGAGNTASCVFTVTVTDELASILQVTVSPTTATPDSLETTPTLGFDGLSQIVVYTRVEPIAGQNAPGDIYYQRISSQGEPLTPPERISFLSTDDRLNDVSGEYIVYSAWDPDNLLHGVIKLYQVLNGSTIDLMLAADTVREARVHGDTVAWVQGNEGGERIEMMDLTAQLLSAVTVSSGNRVSNVEVGSRYIVWEEFEGPSSNIVAYDLSSRSRITVAGDPVMHEGAPSTFGDWVVWRERLASSTRIMARNLAAGGAPFVVANPGAVVQNPGIDGDFITYESRVSGNWDVYLYRLSTGTTHQITDGPGDEILNHVFGNLVAFVEFDGNDSLEVSVAHLAFVAEPSASITTLTLLSTTAAYGGSASLRANLSSPDGPVEGATVSFGLNGTPAGSAVTDHTGLATLSGVSIAGLGAGTYVGVVGASFSGSPGFKASTASGDLTIERASTVTSFQLWQQSFPLGERPSLHPGSTMVADVSGNLIAWTGSVPEVWVLSGANGLSGTPEWTRYMTPGAPVGRTNSAAAYNPANNTLIIFGGCASVCSPAFNDVWVLHHANGLGGAPAWTLLSPSVAPSTPHSPGSFDPPSAREAMARGYDAANNRLIVYGGRIADQSSVRDFQDVWVLVDADGSGGAPQWVQLFPDNAPPPARFGSSSWYDPSSNRLIVAGGRAPSFPAPGFATAVWALEHANGLGGTPHWVNLVPEGAAGSPPPFAWWPAAYDVTDRRALLVEAGTSNLWVLDNANGVDGDARWEHVIVPNPFGQILRVFDQANAPYDAAHHRLSLFDGDRLFVLPSAGATGWVNPSVTGQPVTATVTVSAMSPGGGIPTGTVTFGYGSTNTATVPLNAAGQASFTTPLFPPLSSTISALYNGSANHANSAASMFHELKRAGTTTQVTSSGSPAMFGAPVTFTATVAVVAPGAGTPTGTVTFKDEFSTLGTATLSSLTGKATLVVPFLSIGSHSITAAYSGDPGFDTSTSAALSQMTIPTTTTTTVTSFRNPSSFGESVELTATVDAATDVVFPGTVTFMDGHTTLGTSHVSSPMPGTGEARLPVRSFAAGPHEITAIYSGDSCCVTGSTSPPMTHLVNPAETRTSVNSSPNPSVAGQPVTFTARVSAPFALVPTGTVQFKKGSETLAEGTLSDGQAAFTTDALPVGSHTITAVYGGDADGNFAPSTSLPQMHTVRDVTPPVISVSNVTVEGTAPLTPVTFSFSASDDVDPHPSVTADRASGDLFPLGTTTVTVTATDASGNSSIAAFTVTVVDTTPPTLTLIGANPMMLEGGPPFADPGATASDAVAGDLTSAIVATGTIDTTAVGTYSRTYTVSDGHNSTTVVRTVIVVDTTPPSFTAPPDAVINATAPTGAIYVFTTPIATDAIDETVPVICSPASGSAFPVGTATVTCIATDDTGNATTQTFTVTVLSSEQIVANLIAQIENEDFHRALGLLDSVLRNLARDNVNTACNQLGAFISQVEAQVGKSLSADEAATLMQLANDTRGSLGCS